jgi:predicted DNA-binding protein (MmcQ/YjbR family)
MPDQTTLTPEQARAACAALTGAQLTHPFDNTSSIYKVAGHVFAAISFDDAGSIITLKCDPGYAESLVSGPEDIGPGYHMNKRHWISAHLGRSVPAPLLRELITKSYDLVVAALPARERARLAG